jgi:hypothetical protein
MAHFSQIMRMEGEEQLPEILFMPLRQARSAGDAALDGVG